MALAIAFLRTIEAQRERQILHDRPEPQTRPQSATWKGCLFWSILLLGWFCSFALGLTLFGVGIWSYRAEIGAALETGKHDSPASARGPVKKGN